MSRPALALALLAIALPARALSPFVEAFRKAEARAASDPERVEFATRAIRAWLPKDGAMLLAQAHFRRAEGALSQLDHELAEADLAKAIGGDPNNHAARLMRVEALIALGRGREAEKEAEEYLFARPDDGEGRLALGRARLARGMPSAGAAARKAFAQAATILGPDDPRPEIGNGRSFLAARKPREALVALSAAADRPAAHRVEIFSTRARAYAALGNWRAVREDLNASIPGLEFRADDAARRGVPRARDAALANHADALFRRGVAGEALNAREDALADYRAACGLGLPPACARLDALEAAARKPAPAPKPKPKKLKAPKGDTGERIYAN